MGKMIPHVSKERADFIFKSSKPMNMNPRRWKRQVPSKRREPLQAMQRHISDDHNHLFHLNPKVQNVYLPQLFY